MDDIERKLLEVYWEVKQEANEQIRVGTLKAIELTFYTYFGREMQTEPDPS